MCGLAQPEPSLPCFISFRLFVISMPTRQIQIVRREIEIPLQFMSSRGSISQSGNKMLLFFC